MAQFNLSVAYRKGEGVKADIAEWQRLILLAEEQGYGPAVDILTYDFQENVPNKLLDAMHKEKTEKLSVYRI